MKRNRTVASLEKLKEEIEDQWSTMSELERKRFEMRAQKICNKLNKYEETHTYNSTVDGEANNIWNDLIWDFEDEELTNIADEDRNSTAFTDVHGIIYEVDNDGEWGYILPYTDGQRDILNRIDAKLTELKDELY